DSLLASRCFLRARDTCSTNAQGRLLARPLRIKRDARRSIERAREFVEQLKKERLFARCERAEHARLGFSRRLCELGEQSLAGFCQLQAVPAAVVGADRPRYQAILFQLLEHHCGCGAIETQ